MANEIINVEFRDMFGINPKYEKIIETKLNNADSYNTFKELINWALYELTIKIQHYKDGLVKKDDIRYPYGGNLYRYLENNQVCPNTIYCKDLRDVVSGISGGRLTHYVSIGLLKRVHTSPSIREYAYYLPYDFFVMNDFFVKIIPNIYEKKDINIIF